MRRALGLLLLVATPAFADTPHKEGDYGGVSPTGPARPPEAAPAKPKKLPARGTLSWIGFEAKDGGAQVFLQSVAPFQVSQRVDGASLVVTTDLTRFGANTWRHVDTRFFDNPLAKVVARKAKKGKSRGLEVVVTFKNPKDAREAAVRSDAGPDGMHYAYLTFPPGTEPEAATTPAIPEPEK